MFIATAVIILITLVNILVYKLLQLQESNSADNLSVLSSLPSEQLLCRRFSLAEILSATHKFDESFVIGRGGFGKVYKGVADNGATTVAIKRLNSLSKQGAPEFWTEIEMLSKFRHSHLVALIGYCNIYNEMILVYEYMVHGTLADHLHKIGRNGGDKSPLSWVQRLKICIGAARGLDYLHTGTGVKHRVIHRDVKSSNILLDENWAAKISDFGLSKIGPADQSCTNVSTYVKGTCGYMDPEYLLTHRLTRKSDAYSFGVVLFEVLCGRPAIDPSLHEDQRGLARWAKHCIKEGTVDQIIDPNLRGQILPSCLSTIVEIAGKCLHNRPKKCPTMNEVVSWLEFALALQERRDSSIVEEELFDATGLYDNQEHADYSAKQEVINAANGEHHDNKIGGIIQLDDANGEQSPINPAKRMTFAKKVQFFFSIRRQLIPVPSDAKASRNAKSNTNSSHNSMLPKVPPSGQIVSSNLKMFRFAELKSATRNFGLDMVLGEGGSGMVFKGWVDEKTYAPSKVGVGKAVAIERFKLSGLQGLEEEQTKVEFLGNLTHPNLVKLLGYSKDGEFLIVSEYMQNGSLNSHLFRSVDTLPWVTRLKIAIGAARGIAFLHTTYKPVILRSIESSDILLDGDFNAKLSAFGLVKTGRLVGYSYIAPEYRDTGRVFLKSNVYSFGVVLLEILTGKRVIDFGWPPSLLEKTKLKIVMDPRLEHDYPPEGLFRLTALILKCIDLSPTNRPSMKEVLKSLEQINTVKDETK